MIDWVEMGRKTVNMHCVLWEDIVRLYGLDRETNEE